MNRIISVAAGAIAFIVYWFSLCPTVYIGDSGEFITNAVTLGISHTTGYPLYTLWSAVIVRILWFITPAAAVNIFSALCASLAAAWIVRTVLCLTKDAAASAAAGLMFAFSLTVWQNATVAEVYAFNAMEIALVMFLLVDWHISGSTDSRRVLLMAFLSGLLLTHHTTSLLILFSIALFLTAERRRAFPSVGHFFSTLVIFLFGASVYLYLPFRSSGDPPLDWLNPESFRTLADYFFPMAGRKVMMHDAEGLMNRALWIGKRLLTEELWYFSTLAGFAGTWMKREKAVSLFLVSIAVLNALFGFLRRQPVEGDFASLLIPSVIVLTVLAGIGIAEFRSVILPALLKRRTVYVLAAAAIPAALFALHLERCDRSGNRFGEELGAHFLDGISHDAVLLVEGDEQTFLPWYFKYVDGRYKDITVVNWRFLETQWHSEAVGKELGMNLLTLRTGEERTRMILANYVGRRPVYFLLQIPFDWILQKYKTVPEGFTTKIVSRSDTSGHQPVVKDLRPVLHASFDERALFLLNYYPRMHLLNAVMLANINEFDLSANELELLRMYPIWSKEAEMIKRNGAVFSDSLKNMRKNHLR